MTIFEGEMEMVIQTKVMIELLSHLSPQITVNEMRDILSSTSIKKNNDINTILNALNSADETAIPTLFKNILLQKRGKIKDEMKKKTESYFQEDIGAETFTMGRKIGKGKTVLTVDVLGRKENKDICAFLIEDIDINSFESFKTMLATILSYEKISPVEIFLILPRETKDEIVKHIKNNKTLKYVKTSGTELSAQFKPILYESEIPRTAILHVEKEDIFGDKIEIGKFTGSSFKDKEDFQNFLVKRYTEHGEGQFRCKSIDRFDNKTMQFNIDTTSKLASDVTEITQTTRFVEK